MDTMKVTPEAVEAMLNTADQLGEVPEEIEKELSCLRDVYEETEDGLGNHSASIGSLIEEVEEIGREGKNPILILSLKLQKSALIRQMHIENDVYQSGRSR